MDPLLFWAILITLFIRYTVTDVIYAVRGVEPPRHKERMARLEARAAPQSRVYRSGRHGLSRFLVEAWHDAWDDAHERRQRRRAERKARRDADGLDDSDLDTPPALRLVATPDRDADVIPLPRHRDTVCVPVRGSDGESTPTGPVTPPPAPSPGPASSPGPEPAGPAPTSTSASATATLTRPETDTDTQQEEPVTQPTLTTTPAGDSQPDAETAGLTRAISFSEGMANALRQAAVRTETSIATLQCKGVGPGPLALLTQAMELASQAAAAFQAAHDEFERHVAVREAYNANPDAGDKEFLTND